jgi:hypothetical protein
MLTAAMGILAALTRWALMRMTAPAWDLGKEVFCGV